MKYHFCTLFDRNYLYKGLTLYNSLLKHCPDFVLWILCMDNIAYEILNKINLEKAVLVKLSDFEDEDLRKVKPKRTVAEFCFTCTPSLLLYVLQNKPSVDMIAYLDADLFFYSDPLPVYEEFRNNSIMIIEHRFSEHLRHLEENGIYNVQMMLFRNNQSGIDCLNWWRDRCNEWCYFRLEDGKMGDQKYLDDWPTRFNGVHVLQHKGAGVALWNIERYMMVKRQSLVYIDEDPLIFYHFHQFNLLKNGSYDYGEGNTYHLTPENIKLIYNPYIEAIEESIRQVKTIDARFNCGYKYAKKDSTYDKVLCLPTKVKNRLRRIYKTVTNG
jgi:hypothetical protein